MSEPTTGLRDTIVSLLQRGERARDTIRPADARDAGAPAIASDDWSVSRRMLYDQAQVNRWKTDLLRFLRTHYHEGDAATSDAADPYIEMHGIIDRAGVLWRAVEPGLELLRRLRAECGAAE